MNEQAVSRQIMQKMKNKYNKGRISTINQPANASTSAANTN